MGRNHQQVIVLRLVTFVSGFFRLGVCEKNDQNRCFLCIGITVYLDVVKGPQLLHMDHQITIPETSIACENGWLELEY